MSNDISKFLEQTNAVLGDAVNAVSGLPGESDRMARLDEDATKIKSYNSSAFGEPLVPIQGKDSDGELLFRFEDREDALDLYSFMIETRLLEAGEVVYRDIEGQHSVAFMPHVAIQKPEVIQAALLAYEDRFYTENEEDDEAFESLIHGLTGLLTEAPTKTSGAPKRKKGMGNPFHNKHTGKFSGASDHAASSGGSWAIGKKKLKFTGKGKTKEGGLLAKYGSTSHPCGRAAREQGDDKRCWDGKGGIGAKLKKMLKKKKRAKEDLNVADLSFLMEMRAKYQIL